MDMVEEMMQVVARELTGDGTVVYAGHRIDFNQPWRRIRFYDVLREKTGVEFRGAGREDVMAQAHRLGVKLDPDAPVSKALDGIFSEIVEPGLMDPTFVCDYPKELSPLAKDHRSEPGLVERFEPFVCGFEVGNSFSELNDPIEQRRRFEQQAAFRAEGDADAHVLDEDFIRALEFGMPPAAGLGLGIDRLAMVFTDSPSIRDVIFFPHMRPEEGRGQ
jgi:lysyl-tRNA synthetase class 2